MIAVALVREEFSNEAKVSRVNAVRIVAIADLYSPAVACTVSLKLLRVLDR